MNGDNGMGLYISLVFAVLEYHAFDTIGFTLLHAR